MSDGGEWPVVAGLRPEIALAWRRASLSGLDPGSPVDNVTSAEIDTASRLMVAARPVLDTLAEQLSGTRFSVLLADSNSRIVDRRFGQTSLAGALDDVRAAPGHEYLEQTTGTNALATAFELRHGVAVTGEEHFLESLKQFCCYGHPVVHPISGRLEGVVDLTGYAIDATPLLVPVLKRAVLDIEQRLLAGSRISEQRMLAAFHTRSVRTKQALLVVGEGLTLANGPATDMFDGAAQLALRELRRSGGAADHEITVADGRRMRVRCEPIAGADNAVLVEVVPNSDTRARVPRGARAKTVPVDETIAHRTNRTRVLISGEPGSGRTTTALRLAGDLPVELLDAPTLSEDATFDRLTEMADNAGVLLIVDRIHLMPPSTASRLAQLMDSSGAWFALTSAPVAELDGEQLALATRCPARIATTALRLRRAEIPKIAGDLLRALRPGADLRLSSEALRALSSCSWPGNLGELKAVLTFAASRRAAGVMTLADLPPEYRLSAGARPLSRLEQAEYDTIVAALRRCHGNKVHAAAELEIGRTTLYRRIRVLGIRS